MKTLLKSAVAAIALTTLGLTSASAETRITYKSAKTGSSYYQMGVELAEAMKAGTDGEVIVTVEESQGSVQNVMEVRARGGDYVFTTPPALVRLAQGGKAMFDGKGDPAFDTIRALFPIPSLSDDQIVQTKRATLVIPAGTYAGQEADIRTTSLPVVAYATTAMDDEAAYQLTKTFWESKAKLGENSPWWNGVNEGLMATIEGTIHPGAQRYYVEAGIALTDAQK